MCADRASAKQIPQRIKPRFKKRNELTFYWVNEALKHSGKSPSELAAALNEISANLLSASDRLKYKRYADINSNGSMDYKSLKRFRDNARAHNLLPQSTGLRHSSELILNAQDPEQLITDMINFGKQWKKKKDALIKALSDYIECIEASNREELSALIIDNHSKLPDEGETDFIDEVRESDLKQFLQLIENHAISIKELLASISGHDILNPN